MLTRKQLWNRQIKDIRFTRNLVVESSERDSYCDKIYEWLQPIALVLLNPFAPARCNDYDPTFNDACDSETQPDQRFVSKDSEIHVAGMITCVSETSDATSKIEFQTKGLPRLRSALSMGDLQSALRPNDKKRHMRFSNTVHVCLVPTRDELRNLLDDLYFRSDDFVNFKQEAIVELREVLTKLGITSKQAIQLMYQPQQEFDNKDRECHVSYHDYEGPSLSDNEDDGIAARPAQTNHSMSNIPLEVEGPSLSDDEEENNAFRASVDNHMKAAAFITGIKTDVELNAGISPDKYNKGALRRVSTKALPLRTPSGAISEAHATWQVQWKVGAGKVAKTSGG